MPSINKWSIRCATGRPCFCSYEPFGLWICPKGCGCQGYEARGEGNIRRPISLCGATVKVKQDGSVISEKTADAPSCCAGKFSLDDGDYVAEISLDRYDTLDYPFTFHNGSRDQTIFPDPLAPSTGYVCASCLKPVSKTLTLHFNAPLPIVYGPLPAAWGGHPSFAGIENIEFHDDVTLEWTTLDGSSFAFPLASNVNTGYTGWYGTGTATCRVRRPSNDVGTWKSCDTCGPLASDSGTVPDPPCDCLHYDETDEDCTFGFFLEKCPTTGPAGLYCGVPVWYLRVVGPKIFACFTEIEAPYGDRLCQMTDIFFADNIPYTYDESGLGKVNTYFNALHTPSVCRYSLAGFGVGIPIAYWVPQATGSCDPFTLGFLGLWDSPRLVGGSWTGEFTEWATVHDT